MKENGMPPCRLELWRHSEEEGWAKAGRLHETACLFRWKVVEIAPDNILSAEARRGKNNHARRMR
jgi:hypothetical protein